MAYCTASDAANWFLLHNEENILNGADRFSNLKIQKMLYYAQGAVMCINGSELFCDPIKAWKHGPVVESQYVRFKEFGSDGIIPETLRPNISAPLLTAEVEETLCEVYDTFGQYSAWGLRELTHTESPWKDAPQNSVISPAVIKNYFSEHYIEDGQNKQ